MSVSVSIICASPSRFNAGMEAVDRGWDIFERRCSLDLKSVKYRFDKISYNGGPQSGYECLLDEKVYRKALNSDAIIFWGDFLQMDRKIRRYAQRLFEDGIFETYEDAFDFTTEVLLMSQSSKKARKKVVRFGGTLLLDSPKTLRKEPYHTHLTQLIRDSKAWLGRDYYTADTASILGNNDNTPQGVDCAILGWNSIYNNNAASISKRKSVSKKVGVFFGRSVGVKKHFKLGRFAQALASSMNASTVWVPWIEKRKKIGYSMLRRSASKFSLDDTKLGYSLDMEDLSWMEEFDFIITDTYHLSVNAWSAGIPAVCIADIIRHSDQDVSRGERFSWRDKRYMFFMKYDALDFFVHGSELMKRGLQLRRIQHIAACLKDRELLTWIQKRLSASAMRASRNLEKAITELG